MFSPMAFDAPGSMTFERVAFVCLLCLYPAILGILYLIFGWKFFGLSSKSCAVILIGVPVAAVFLFGYPRSTYLLWKGIPLHGYAVKEGKVYYQGDAFDADPKTFQVVDSIFCAKDANRVYNYRNPIPDADPASFEKIPDSLFYKDKNFVYARLGAYIERVPGIRGENFQLHRFTVEQGSSFPSRYSSDGVNAYYSNRLEKIEGLDASRIWVHGAYAGDGKGVYYQGKKFSADPASFIVLSSGETYVQNSTSLAKDKGSVYLGDISQDADAQSFELLARGYARDLRNVYHVQEGFEVLEGANPTTFKVVTEGYEADATDGEKKYRWGKPYSKEEGQ